MGDTRQGPSADGGFNYHKLLHLIHCFLYPSSSKEEIGQRCPILFSIQPHLSLLKAMLYIDLGVAPALLECKTCTHTGLLCTCLDTPAVAPNAASV